jgi:hypothetical protein
MAQIHEPPPNRTTVRVERPYQEPGELEPPGRGASAARTAAVVLMLAAITLIAAGAGFLLAGGRLPSATPTPAPAAGVADAPAAPPPATQADPTAPPAPTAAPTVASKPTDPPAPTDAPTAAPPKPTAPPPVAVPPPAPAAKPDSAPPAAPAGSFAPARPGIDPRRAKIEGRIREYFEALRAEDFARARQVCCTEEWRAQHPLDRWERNFDGVTDLRLVGAPRYVRVEDDVVVVDTDYTFLSGGARRSFTLRWTFRPVGDDWQAALAEAFPTQ